MSAVVAGLVCVVLSVAAGTAGRSWAVDTSVLSWMLGHRTPAMSTVMVAITTAGGTPLGIAVLAVLGVIGARRRSWSPLVAGVVVGAGATVAATVLKVVVDRPRPPVAVQITLETDPGFPSRHVSVAAAVLLLAAFVVAQGLGRAARVALWAGAAVVVALVAVSRLYLGVHWLSDVAGALALGVAIGSTGCACVSWSWTRTGQDRQCRKRV